MIDKIYSCPMHPEVTSDKPGRCHKCGMALVERSDKGQVTSSEGGQSEEKKGFFQTYKPLLIIVGLIFLPVLALSWKDVLAGDFVWQRSASQFMGGFFLVFSGFKLLDLKGFAQGYFTYDFLARRVFSYGYIYPFIELILGLSYLTGFNPQLTNMATLTVMTFSGAGVLTEVLKGKKIKCVCLGTVIDVPLTAVTIIEDFGMAAMALLMLLG